MKQFYMTFGRERNLIRFSEKSDLKDAKPFSFEEAKENLIKVNPDYAKFDKAEKYLNGIKENPFNDWQKY